MKREGNKNGERGEEKKSNPRAAQVNVETSPIPGLSADQYTRLLKHFSGEDGLAYQNTTPKVNMAGKNVFSSPWIIDFGASEHITHNVELLHDKKEYINGAPVIIPNGNEIPVKGVGSSTLPNGLQLNDVLHIPDFKCNLLSVSKITNDLQSTLTFWPGFCIMQDLLTRNLIGTGNNRDALYYLEPTLKRRTAMIATPSMETWHRRLGHASNSKLRYLDFFG